MSNTPFSTTFGLPDDLLRAIETQLVLLYGRETGAATFERLRARLERFVAALPQPPRERRERLRLTAADAMLITYGDQIRTPGQAPLAALGDWLTTHLFGVLSSVHLLPFYPYSSDDGFSVIDYTAVDPELGTWQDVERLAGRFKLMFDAVINHISAQSEWFHGFLRGDPRYADFFIVVDEPVDLSSVTRPRTHPLLTTFETATGPHNVWTTFSADQIDLNYRNPEVLLTVVDVLLQYVAHGASYLRLDAIGYLWKTIGTSCIHLPETHAVVQLIRSVLDAVAPHVILITETNVPHADNVSYFGDGYNEAQLVYQFALAPLVLNAFQTGSTRHLQDWASELSIPASATTFFNFLASHDGIGVVPARDILSGEEVDALVEMTLRHGGRVSYKTNPDGSQSPYELNITLFDALSDPATTPAAEAIDRFMAAQAIMLAMVGMPGIYVHSLVGSSNNLAGLQQTGRARTINRQKWQRAELEARLADRSSRERIVLERYKHLLRRRATSPAFDPVAGQRIVRAGEAVFAFLRIAPDGSEAVLCLHNVTAAPQRVELRSDYWGGQPPSSLRDVLSTNVVQLDADGSGQIELAPYAVAWLRAAS